MEEKNKKLTDEQLSQQLRKSKGGKWGGMLLSLLGGVLVFVGIVQGGSLVLIIAGVVILALGQTAKGKSKEQAGRQTFDALAPDIVSTVFDNIQMDPTPHILDAKDTNIPLPGHTYCSGSGYIRGTYQGLTTELCTVRLTEVNEFQREETGQWEKNEREVYTGQWMLCELNREFPTWLTIWPTFVVSFQSFRFTVTDSITILTKRFQHTCHFLCSNRRNFLSFRIVSCRLNTI